MQTCAIAVLLGGSGRKSAVAPVISLKQLPALLRQASRLATGSGHIT